MLLHPDGSEEVLVAGGDGAVTDPFVSFDAQWVYYSYFPDVRAAGATTTSAACPTTAPTSTASTSRRARSSSSPSASSRPTPAPATSTSRTRSNPGAGYDRLGYGILNLGPAPLAGGKIAFTSNRNGFVPPRGLTNPTLQLFVMDEDGANVTQIAPMNIGSALHPTPLRDGRMMFSIARVAGPARRPHVGHLVDLARRPPLGAGRERLPRAGRRSTS